MKIKIRRITTGFVKKAESFWNKMKGVSLAAGMKKEPGIDGILVTVGLCIIALLLCVVMKDSLKVFIETIVKSMTTQAQNILTGVA